MVTGPSLTSSTSIMAPNCPVSTCAPRERSSSMKRSNNGPLTGPNNLRKTLSKSAVGRNVALFDLTRHWAYRAIRSHWGGPQGTWETDVFAYAWQRNETVIANDFTQGPLTHAEVTHLARSIARWTWRRTTRQTFRARQTALSKQGNEVRHAAARSRWENLT